MILVFGGTTEGRIAVKTLDEGEGRYVYSTRSPLQVIDCGHGEHICGEMTESMMIDFCKENDVRLIVDAAHPFAAHLHANISKVADTLSMPVIRFERRYVDIDSSEITWCDDYEDAVLKMNLGGVHRLLALTGVQTISRLRTFWENNDTWFRILNREESIDKAMKAGFPMSRLVFYNDDATERIIEEISPDAIITKESGDSGGFQKKIAAALEHGVKVFVVRRPKLPENFIVVEGRYGLRREIERLLPEFYPLHTGFTTGSCATAAAKAALIALLTREQLTEVSFRIPEGETMKMEVESVTIDTDFATAFVIKDSGDDPDVTDGCWVSATVGYADHPGIRFHGGEGIGTVTLPGLGLEVGEPAINPTPRKNMTEELSAIYSGGLDVTISLENGAQLAEKTFNPRVGVMGGVSIIGTTGIIRPFSHEAFIDCIRREMDVALAMDCDRVVVNSGGKSERFMKALYPGLPSHAFIHYGNAIGETMEIAREKDVPRMVIGLMLGKAVKLAEGNMDTHSHKITVSRDFLKQLAKEAGCSDRALDVMDGFNLARELPSLLSETDAYRFFPILLRRCHSHCATIFPNTLDAILLSDDGIVLAGLSSEENRELGSFRRSQSGVDL